MAWHQQQQQQQRTTHEMWRGAHTTTTAQALLVSSPSGFQEFPFISAKKNGLDDFDVYIHSVWRANRLEKYFVHK